MRLGKPQLALPDSIHDAKSALRGRVLALVKKLTPDQRAAASAAACARLKQQSVWRESDSVLLFAPSPHEIDIWPLMTAALEAGKMAALPRFEARTRQYVACRVGQPELEVRAGHLGIREPVAGCARVALNRLDLILVPGVAFDLHGRRLGRGKGHYDRLLAAVRGSTCGVAFDEQIVRRVPVEPHDIQLDCILTPTRWLKL